MFSFLLSPYSLILLLGLLFCDNPLNIPPIGNIWTDYQFDIPIGDQDSTTYPIERCKYVKRCSYCSGRGYEICTTCNGSGLSYDRYVILACA